jgi:hypothetical protein
LSILNGRDLPREGERSHGDARHHDGKKIVGTKEVPECIGQWLRDPDRRRAIDVHDIEEEDEDAGAGIGRGLTAFFRRARIGPGRRRSAPSNAHGGELIDRLKDPVFKQLELVAPQIVDRHAILRRRVGVDANVVCFGAKGWPRLVL